MIDVAILGGTGYGAGELLRLLSSHREATVVSVVSASSPGERMESAHSHLSGYYPGRTFDAALDVGALSEDRPGVIFSALPHAKSAAAITELLARSLPSTTRIIDLSGDLRITDEPTHLAHYPEVAFAPELRSQFVYGLPELNADAIACSRFVANPGCLAAACALAYLPLADLPVVGPVVFDAKTGTSGAGRTPQASMHHPMRHANFEAYKILAHRHEAEIQQSLAARRKAPVETMFVPHLLPVSRGIFATAYAKLEKGQTPEEISTRYRDFYRNAPFIRIREESPSLSNVVGTNHCDLFVTVRGTQVVACAALDNLVKGMAGTAIENMNLMCGIDRAEGLRSPALGIL